MRAHCLGALAIISLLAGCATSSSRLNGLQLGLGRDEVVEILGRPHSVSAEGEVEYLAYNLLAKGAGGRREYVVKFQAGKVVAFGEREDFGQQRFVPAAPAAK